MRGRGGDCLCPGGSVQNDNERCTHSTPGVTSLLQTKSVWIGILAESSRPSARRRQIRTLGRKGQWPYPAGPQDIEKRSAELRIAVMKEIPLTTKKTGTLVRGITRHLQHPLGGGMFGQTRETDPARFQMNEEQDVVGGETSPSEHFHGEEVGASQNGHVGSDEILPGGVLTALGCRLDPVSSKDVSHSLIGNRVTEIAEGAPAMRSYLQPEFSLAKRTMSASSSGSIRGRPGEVRNLDPSNFEQRGAGTRQGWYRV